jgi:uncharacterized membrane protein
MTETAEARIRARPDPALATVLLGIGLGGFFDGIVLHQILQWHHLLSAHVPPETVPNLEINTLADGVFHAATWVFTVAGLILLYQRLRDGASLRWRGLIAGLLAGWGGFNVVEGIVNHQILGLHNVRTWPDELLYDIGFLVWGAAMAVIGVVLLRRSGFQRAAD